LNDGDFMLAGRCLAEFGVSVSRRGTRAAAVPACDPLGRKGPRLVCAGLWLAPTGEGQSPVGA